MKALMASILLTAAILGAAADIVRGNGSVVTERRSLSSFSSISLGGLGTLRVHRGGQRVEITSDSNILPFVTTSVSGGELRIGVEPSASIVETTKLQFDVTLPELEGLRLSGSGDAYVDAFKGEDFTAAVSGSGGVKAQLDYRRVELYSTGSGGFDAKLKAATLNLRCSGSGEAYVDGAADLADIVVTGSGMVGARDFAVADARVLVAGSGRVEIRAASSLRVAISGSGEVRYWGSPRIDQNLSGSGRVSKAGD